MIIYEVALEFQKSIEDEYRNWLNQHIDDMLEIEGFAKAKLFEQLDFTSDPQAKSVVVHYYVESLELLERYFANEAKQMRGEALELFPDKFRASRRILKQN